MQPIYRQQFQIDPAAVDCFGRLKPSRLLLYAQEVAGHHSDQLALTYDALAAKGLFWAVIRNRVQITRLPLSGETITLETWPMPTTRTAYPRSTVAYDAAGNELFRAISLWILMDRNTRAMILPGKSGVTVEGSLRGMELDTPRPLLPKPLANCSRRNVCFSDLDVNGHMNNARYLDWAMDLLPSAFHKEHTLKDMTLCYMNEAREEQVLDVTWDGQSEEMVQVDIHRPKENGTDYDRIFPAGLQFEKVVL
jgi:acyl-ACP thioesterase